MLTDMFGGTPQIWQSRSWKGAYEALRAPFADANQIGERSGAVELAAAATRRRKRGEIYPHCLRFFPMSDVNGSRPTAARS